MWIKSSPPLSMSVKAKKKNVRGIIQIDGVVKCPAGQRCCVSKALAEFCLLVLAAIDISV